MEMAAETRTEPLEPLKRSGVEYFNLRYVMRHELPNIDYFLDLDVSCVASSKMPPTALPHTHASVVS